MTAATPQAEVGIKVSTISVDQLRHLLSDDNVELLKFNRYSKRLADENYSVDTISNQIIEIDKILKENKIEFNKYNDINKNYQSYPCAKDVRNVMRADMKMKIMDKHNYYIQDVINPEDYGVEAGVTKIGVFTKFYNRISKMLR